MFKALKAKVIAFWNDVQANDFQFGYDCAAGLMLRGEATPAMVRQSVNVAKPNAVERGALAAAADYTRMQRHGTGEPNG